MQHSTRPLSASHTSSSTIPEGSDLGDWRTPPTSPNVPEEIGSPSSAFPGAESSKDAEAADQARRLLKGKGREVDLISQEAPLRSPSEGQSFPPTSPLEKETRTVEETLAAWAKSDKQRRATVRRSAQSIKPPPPAPSFSDLSRRSSNLVKRATSVRSGASRQKSADSQSRHSNLGHGPFQGLPDIDDDSQNVRLETIQGHKGPASPLRVDTTPINNSHRLAQSSRNSYTGDSSYLQEDEEEELKESPISQNSDSTITRADSPSTSSFATGLNSEPQERIGDQEMERPNNPDFEALKMKAVRAGSRFVEDLSSQSMAGKEPPDLTRSLQGHSDTPSRMRLPWNKGNRSRTNSAQSTAKANRSSQASMDETALDGILAITAANQRTISRNSYAASSMSVPDTPSGFFPVGLSAHSSLDLSSTFNASRQSIAGYFPSSSSTRNLISPPRKSLNEDGGFTKDMPRRHERMQGYDSPTGAEADRLVARSSGAATVVEHATYDSPADNVFALAGWFEYICCLGCLRGQGPDDDYEYGIQGGRTNPME